MPSPGISFGDLMVFVGVVVIVSVFLIFVRSFVKRAEAPEEPAPSPRRQRESKPVEKSGPPQAEQATS